MALGVSAAPINNEAPRQLEKLAKELAANEYSVREKATLEMWGMGTSALPRLKELSRAKDPEQAIRARELVRKIEMGLFPDTDPELLAIVRRYPNALPSEKIQMVRDLQNRGAWLQMLKLHQEETNDSVRQQLQGTMEAFAVRAAREKLAKGKPADALALLKLAPRTPKSLLAIAHLHRAQGNLQAELSKVENETGTEAAEWRLALFRAAGRISDALAEVDSSKDPKLAAIMAALNGDPLPWLRLRSALDDDARARVTRQEASIIYARLAIDRWNNQKMNTADLAKLDKMLDNRSSQYRRVGRTTLFMLGEIKAAEESMVTDEAMTAVHYLFALERIDEALKLLGRTVEQPCTEQWVSDQFKDLDEDAFADFEESAQVQSLYLMAGFLESRGEHQLAYECFRKPALEFANREKAAFLNFLMKLINQPISRLPAPELAIRLSTDWAKDDDERWDSLTDAFWAGDDDSHEWWRMLGDMSPELSRAERLKLVMIVSRRLPGKPGERKKWLDLAWKHFEKSDENDREDVLHRLTDLAFSTGDVDLSEKVWPHMPEDMGSDLFWRQQIAHLTARDDWDGACDILLKQVDETEKKADGFVNPSFYAYAASALRRAGRDKKAKEYDRLVDLLFLGDGWTAMQIASAYAFGDDYERSAMWSERAAFSVAPDNSRFTMILASYADTILFESSKWKTVAAINELAGSEIIDTSYYDETIPLGNMRFRLKADTYRALSRMKTDERASLEILKRCHEIHVTDGVLADFFFPVLRQAGLIQQHDEWFAESWKRFTAVLDRHPHAANTQNTASWFASRAQRALDEALIYQTRALESFPEQPAYLDTMAEIYFAKGKRKESLNWSRKAIMNAPTDTELRRQFHHFRNDPMPK